MAKKIIELANQKQVIKIIMGLSMDEEGHPSLVGRSARRLAQEITNQGAVPVVYWDEDCTTNQAQESFFLAGISKKRRKGHHDDLAAAVLLQSYIESTKYKNPVEP